MSEPNITEHGLTIAMRVYMPIILYTSLTYKNFKCLSWFSEVHSSVKPGKILVSNLIKLYVPLLVKTHASSFKF